jgi:acetyl esterase/lipase
MQRAGARALISVAALCSGSVGWAEAIVPAEVAAAPVVEDRYPRSTVEFPVDVEGVPDLVYSVLPGYRPLRLDLYKPKATATNGRPLVVYIHGGGWQSGHTRHAGAFANWPGVLASLAARGFVVASIEYRLSSEATFPAAVQDVKKSVRWLRAKAKDFDIDPTRALLWGGSAGGQLAALAATTCGNSSLAPVLSAEEAGLQAQSDCVQGLVAWYGVFDLSTIWSSSEPAANRNQPAGNPAVKYLGCVPTSCAEKAALASPVMQVDPRDPPTLLIHGELDKVVPVAQSRAFESVLRSKGVPVELRVIPGVDHSFIGSSPEATRTASREALMRTFAFIDATLGKKGP